MGDQSLSTYYQYLSALTDLIKHNGNEILSERQIQSFILRYDLNKRFGITSNEVWEDAYNIVAQIPATSHSEYISALESELLLKAKVGLADYEIENFINEHNYRIKYGLNIESVRGHLASLVNGSWVPLITKPSIALQTNREYRSALRNRVLTNGDIPLGDNAIRVLLKRGGFENSCGLDVETVKQDMYALPNKYNVLILIGENCKAEHQYRNEAASPSVQSRRPVESPTHKSVCCKIDREMYTTVSLVLSKYNDALSNRQQLSGLLKDISPNRRREINILLQAYDLGIIDELKRCTVIDDLFISRFSGKIENEYGTYKPLATEMLLVWCLCYGHDILHLELNCSVDDALV